jgi:hypothetical protein
MRFDARGSQVQGKPELHSEACVNKEKNSNNKTHLYDQISTLAFINLI